ncbi:MAG: hypothetical protein H6510_17015 [Acidobacteria bacterium]|nr:hypothetical protein [Acidobacteriota bacterium]MCB9399515.1 hypothetical protein [Acidobacteriota bacterium]
MFDKECFEKMFDLEVPLELDRLYRDKDLIESHAVGFKFRDIQFVVEVQYFSDMGNLESYEVEKNYFIFAIDTDGFELIVDVTSPDLEILQREYGKVDAIGVKLGQILTAEKYELKRSEIDYKRKTFDGNW